MQKGSGNEVITYGCRLNTYESQIIKDNLAAANLSNVAVFNTCAVTQAAENDAIKAISKYKQQNPNKKIIVTGCAAQINSSKLAQMPEIDLLLGNKEKLNSANYILGPEPKVLTSNIFDDRVVDVPIVTDFEGKTRAFVQVQNGCNHFCTFCIIPKGRGRNRAVPVAQVVQQVQTLFNNGYKEIIFTGVDITDYGWGIPGKPTLANLIKRVLSAVPNLQRLRLSSVDVAEIDDELFELCAHEPRIMPHFHISLQSGDDIILERMRRRHNRQQVIDFCSKMHAIRPNAAFGADIIVGFPTETDEMFGNTCKLVDEAGLHFLHVFPYSIRPGTPAATMEQVEHIVKKQRAKTLRTIGDSARDKLYKSMHNTRSQVLVEAGNRGKTANFCPVDLTAVDAHEGQVIDINLHYDDTHGVLKGQL